MMAHKKARKVKVRKFRESDVEDALEIFTADRLIHNEEERERTRKGLLKNAKEPEWYDHFLIAELDGRVVGRVILELAYPPYSELINLYVLPAYQRRGIGTSLVQQCIRIASTSNCFVMAVMADPVGNLPAHRLYSKFGFKPGILGDPSKQRGHMWLFRFSEESWISEFLKNHPFAEPSVSQAKVDFHGRMLYQMSWRDPQTVEKVELYLEGQPSQTLEGTMPRVAGFSYMEKNKELDLLVEEEDKTLKPGTTSSFSFTIWNSAPKPIQFSLVTSIPDGTKITPQSLSSIQVEARNEKKTQFRITWIPNCKLPDFTSFSTVLATCYLNVENSNSPLFASAGFRKE